MPRTMCALPSSPPRGEKIHARRVRAWQTTEELPECASMRAAAAWLLSPEAGSEPWNCYAQGQSSGWLASAPLQITKRLQLPGVTLSEAWLLEQFFEHGLVPHRAQALGQ